MGCDGLVLLGTADATVGQISTTKTPAVRNVSGGVQTIHCYRGTCIVWKDTAEAAAAVDAQKAAAKAALPPPDPRCSPGGRRLQRWGGVCGAEKVIPG